MNIVAGFRRQAIRVLSRLVSKGEPCLSIAQLHLCLNYITFLRDTVPLDEEKSTVTPRGGAGSFRTNSYAIDLLSKGGAYKSDRHWNDYNTIMLVLWSTGLSLLQPRQLLAYEAKRRAAHPDWEWDEEVRFIPYRYLASRLPQERQEAWADRLSLLLLFLDEISSERITHDQLTCSTA